MISVATLGDVFRVYLKPSLNGRLVIRKRNTIQTSARVEASKERVKARPPAGPAHDALVAAGKCPEKRVYVPGRGYEVRPVCPISEFRKQLSIEMKRTHGGA
ncbi:MAG: hypothetical protein ACXQTS_06890 [Candidatus Methanospirareceae archaeon]